MSRTPVTGAVINTVLAKQIAGLALIKTPQKAISEQLGLTAYQVGKIMASDEFKAALKEIGDASVAEAKQTIRAQTSKLAQEVTRVLTAKLQEDNLEAVKIALKIIGFDEEEKVTGDTNISVVLPGVAAPVKTVESDVIEIESE